MRFSLFFFFCRYFAVINILIFIIIKICKLITLNVSTQIVSRYSLFLFIISLYDIILYDIKTRVTTDAYISSENDRSDYSVVYKYTKYNIVLQIVIILWAVEFITYTDIYTYTHNIVLIYSIKCITSENRGNIIIL